MKMRSLALLTVATLVAATVTHAQSISLNTGMSGAAGTTAIAAGGSDPNWQISTNGTSFAAAVVTFPSNQCCGMATVSSAAQWISDRTAPGSIESGWGIGNTVYARRTFDLSAFDLSGTSMSFTWRVADNLVGIFFNGTQIQGPIDETWAEDRTITVAASSPLWILGVNVLEFRGTSINSTWDGFYVAGSVTGPAAPGVVPEPSTYALMATGLAGLLILRRRKSRAS